MMILIAFVFLVAGIICVCCLINTIKEGFKAIDSTLFRATDWRNENTKDLIAAIDKLKTAVELDQSPCYMSDIADSLRKCEKIEYVANIENLKNDNFVSKKDMQDSMQFLMRYIDFYTKVKDLKR